MGAFVKPGRRRVAAVAAMAAAILGGLAGDARGEERILPVAILDGSNGLRLYPPFDSEMVGYAVSAAGDVNGDGLADVFIGAGDADRTGNEAGAAYVVFGRASYPAQIALGALDGSSGFRIDGKAAFDMLGRAVAAGDLDGDGLDDLVVGADHNTNNATESGAVYVIYGSRDAYPATIDVGSLSAAQGFRLQGNGSTAHLGHALAIGDINADGHPDLIVGAHFHTPLNYASGSTYVLYGRGSRGFTDIPDVDVADAANRFRLDGVNGGEYSGSAVAAIGDFNGDGIGDLLIGAPQAGPSTPTRTGRAYVVFGRSGRTFPATTSLATLNGSNGVRLDGENFVDSAGDRVAGLGDINGDGFPDIAVGARYTDVYGDASGAAYIVYGHAGAGFPAVLPLGGLDGNSGFRIDGGTQYLQVGSSVAAAGDVNGDGCADFLIGAAGGGGAGPDAGSVYLVFGCHPFPAAMQVGNLPGNRAVRLDGSAAGDDFGHDVAPAGDLNGDGIGDVLIGAPMQGGHGKGAAYIVFGNAPPHRIGAAVVELPPILEDSLPANGATLASLLSGRYRDVQPLAGAAVDASPDASVGVWQFAYAGTPDSAVPNDLSASHALLLGADASGAQAGALRFAPKADAFGQARIVLRMWDGTGRFPDPLDLHPGTGQDIASLIGSLGGFADDADEVEIVQTVLPVNDAPDFAAVDPPESWSDAGEVVLPAWASFSPGPANEGDQVALEYLVDEIDDPGLFAPGKTPRVDVENGVGTLRYTPAASLAASGRSGFRVRVRDSGGTQNDGADLSLPHTYSVRVLARAEVIFRAGFE